MSIEQNKNIIQNTFAALNQRNLDGVVARCTPDCRFHGWAPETLNAAGYKATMSALLDAFPDSRFPVDEMIAEGDRVVVRHSLRGTHEAEFQGIPATGKTAVINGIAIFRLENDKAAEVWLSADFMGMLQQLGVVPLA